MKNCVRDFVYCLAALAIVLGGCAHTATRGWPQVSEKPVYVPFENQTPYILVCEIKDRGRLFSGWQTEKNIPAGINSFMWLPPQRDYVIEGTAFAGNKPVGYFVRRFSTVDYIVRNDSLVVAAPVVIDDIFSTHLPALSVVVVNMCQDPAVAYVRVFNPQKPEQSVVLRGLGSYDFMTVVSGPIQWVQEYYDAKDHMILRTVTDDELSPRRRQGIMHGGHVVDVRRIIY